jgi:hypothetical protein
LCVEILQHAVDWGRGTDVTIQATSALLELTGLNHRDKKIPAEDILNLFVYKTSYRDGGYFGLWTYAYKLHRDTNEPCRFDMVVEVNETERWARIRPEFIGPLTIAMRQFGKYAHK